MVGPKIDYAVPHVSFCSPIVVHTRCANFAQVRINVPRKKAHFKCNR